MLPARDRDTDSRDAYPAPIILTAEALRNAQAQHAKSGGKGEDRISVFWRVFGGTLLSIGALVCITLFQQLTNGMSELRTNMNRLNEGRGDLVKLDDFNTRTASIWNSIKELQTANAVVSGLKERSALLEQQVKAVHDQLTERITATANGMKEIEGANAAISALRERSAVTDQQLKAAEEERKELVHEIQRLRERLAALEGRQNATQPPGAAPKPSLARPVAPKSPPGTP